MGGVALACMIAAILGYEVVATQSVAGGVGQDPRSLLCNRLYCYMTPVERVSSARGNTAVGAFAFGLGVGGLVCLPLGLLLTGARGERERRRREMSSRAAWAVGALGIVLMGLGLVLGLAGWSEASSGNYCAATPAYNGDYYCFVDRIVLVPFSWHGVWLAALGGGVFAAGTAVRLALRRVRPLERFRPGAPVPQRHAWGRGEQTHAEEFIHLPDRRP